ncbi:MAG: hypothetical protein PSX71_07720 [bacterium]|nr:hypothetical protein [bacterium]
MADPIRQRSPNAPSSALEDVISKTLVVYDKEHRQPAPVDAVAKDLGYKDANNGAAKQVLASMRQFGLLGRPKEGYLAVSKEVEDYRYAPDERMKSAILITWLKTPKVFSELLSEFPTQLPSDASLLHKLIGMGFMPSTAHQCLDVFKSSVTFAKYYTLEPHNSRPDTDAVLAVEGDSELIADSRDVGRANQVEKPIAVSAAGHERVPIRLKGGRRAYLEVPSPFYEGDKKTISAMLDAIAADEDEL